MASKENVAPVSKTKSKIPLPKFSSMSSAVKKGKKRSISPTAVTSDPKRSPCIAKRSFVSSKGKVESAASNLQPQRKIFGELPCDPRKIVKVRRKLDEDNPSKLKSIKSVVGKITSTFSSKQKVKTSKKQTGGEYDFEALKKTEDQSGIVFEKDDFALQSILDETGIQFVPSTAGKPSRGTSLSRNALSGMQKPQRVSKAPEKKVNVADFGRICDEFLSRTAYQQPNAKRQCTGTASIQAEDFNPTLTPTKTDFCGKYGVEKCLQFEGVAPASAHKSLSRRASGRPFDSIYRPSRTSLAIGTPRKQGIVGEDVMGSRRHTLAMQTPRRVLKKINPEDCTSSEDNVGLVGTKSSASIHSSGRVSLAAQSVFQTIGPGRVSLAAQSKSENLFQASGVIPASSTPGRVSLAAQSTSHSVGIGPGRVSLAAQSKSENNGLVPVQASETPGRVSLYDKNRNHVTCQSARRMSRSAHPPGRVSLSAQKPLRRYDSEMEINQGRLSFAAQLPGRVSLSAQKTKPYPMPMGGRISMIDPTPGRVKKAVSFQKTEENMPPNEENVDNLCKNLDFEEEDMETAVESVETADEKMEDTETNTVPKPKEEKIKTPKKETKGLSGATPLRIKKLLEDENKTPKITPQRVPKLVLTPQGTPQRVQVSDTKSPFCTPKQGPQRVTKPTSTFGTPRRILIETSSPSLASDLPKNNNTCSLLVPKKEEIKRITPEKNNSLKMKEQNVKTSSKDQRLEATPCKTKGGDLVDLRTVWKTKKTPSKSPIVKEILTKETAEPATLEPKPETTSGCALSTVKKKKTISWAETLESCRSSSLDQSGLHDETWESPNIQSNNSHDAMQDNLPQEETTSSPTDGSHVTLSQNSKEKMQLPVCLTGSHITYTSERSDDLLIAHQSSNGDLHAKAEETLVNHPASFTQFRTESPPVTHSELGQQNNNGNVLANNTQTEFLQKQIAMFQEKKKQLSELQMQIQLQLGKGSSGLGTHAYHARLDNDAKSVNSHWPSDIGFTQFELADNKLKQVNLYHGGNCHENLNVIDDKNQLYSQGANVSLDLNSNVTGTDADDAFKTSSQHENNPISTAAKVEIEKPASFTILQTSNNHLQHTKINATPVALKPKSNNLNEHLKTNTFDKDVVKETSTVIPMVENQSGSQNKVNVPIWTPLAMKIVARKPVVVNSSDDNSDQTDSKVDCDSAENIVKKPKIDNVAKSEGDINVIKEGYRVHVTNSHVGLVPTDSESQYLEECYFKSECVKTPPSKKSAFRQTGRSGLSPVVGSLSLRANSEKKHVEKSKKKAEMLHNSVLKIANEKYFDALMDDEVSLYMCRLSPGFIGKTRRDVCFDPVAKILLYGDEMHFIPIGTEEFLSEESQHIEGSAFTKYSVRAT